MPSVCVVIVTYNGSEWIDKCLASVGTTSLPVHTVVVDNASSDDTVERVRARYPEVELIALDSNLGFGQGNNLGLKRAVAAAADYVFLLNQDAWLLPGTLERLVEAHQANAKFGILSPVHLDRTERACEDGFFNHLKASSNSGRMLAGALTGSAEVIYEVEFINAALWLIAKDCLLAVGGFDPIFYHYGEDDNYVHRAQYHGFKLGVVPTSRAVHARQGRPAPSTWDGERRAMWLRKKILVGLCNITKSEQQREAALHWATLQVGRQVLRSTLRQEFAGALAFSRLGLELQSLSKKAAQTRQWTTVAGPTFLRS